jgi:mRNA-degrading endonuclease RelE of RelBE toxin-antitoxin system
MLQLRNEMLSVRIATTAWRQLGAVPSDTFSRIKDKLYELAENPTDGASAKAPEERYFTVDDFVAMYAVDLSNRLITLVEVARRLPEGA